MLARVFTNMKHLANNLGLFIEQQPQHVPSGSDLAGIFGLLYDILRNPSLVVSIPVLHCWSKLLRSSVVRDSQVVTQMVGGLLETCCARLIRYESFPEDSDEPSLLFLNEDIDTLPERHAFLGNYRRFCADVIDVLVRRTPAEAMEHILSQATNTFQSLYNNRPSFQRMLPLSSLLSLSLTSDSANLFEELGTGFAGGCTGHRGRRCSEGVHEVAFYGRLRPSRTC